MLSEFEVINRLEHIYVKIPNKFPCRHCHECCNSILWFKPEETLIKDYLKKHNIKYIICPTEQFDQLNMRCPFLKDDRCVIYSVRPIVCRLQGNIPELLCKYNKNRLMTKKQFNKIKREFDTLVKDVNGVGIFYSSRNLIL